MDMAIACLICLIGGTLGGLIGVGGGAIFVPAMTILLAKGQVEAEATSLLMIGLVAVAGAWRQRSYGNVHIRDAAIIGLLSPVGVLAGVVAANVLPERALRIGFAILVFYMAWRLLRRAFADGPGPPDESGAGGPRAGGPGAGPGAGGSGAQPPIAPERGPQPQAGPGPSR